MSVNTNELISSSLINAALWGPTLGLFALSLAYDHPSKKQIAIACLIAAAVFSLAGSTVHYTVSRIFQNQEDTNVEISTTWRTIRVAITTFLTPLTVLSIFILSTQNIRSVRNQSLFVMRKYAQKRYLATFAISALAIQILFTQIFANGDKSTPFFSKKSFTQLSTSAFVAGSSLFFAVCFGLI